MRVLTEHKKGKNYIFVRSDEDPCHFTAGSWSKSGGARIWNRIHVNVRISIMAGAQTMLLIFDGDSAHVAHAYRKLKLFGENKIRFVTALVFPMSLRDQILEIALYMRTYF